MSNEAIFIILFSVFIAAAIIHLYFYVFIFSKFISYKQSENTTEKQPVSVIICAKNEVNNLRKFLPSVLDQSYPDFEVIVVNDGSWDETGEYLKEINPNYSNLKIVSLPEQDKYKHGKKFALALGIKAAKNEKLL